MSSTGPALLAAAFDVERVLVSKGVYNSGVEGGTDSFSFMAGKNALLTYSNPTRRPTLRRRHRGLQRLAHRPPMNTMPRRELPDRQALPITISSDLLKLLHSGSHFPLAPDRCSMSTAPSARYRTPRWGHFRPSDSWPRGRRLSAPDIAVRRPGAKNLEGS